MNQIIPLALKILKRRVLYANKTQWPAIYV
jgi:hypothetical protein